jgi:hypothetical protein
MALSSVRNPDERQRNPGYGLEQRRHVRMILFAPPTGGKLLSSSMKPSINDLVGGHVDPYLSSRHRDATGWTAATGHAAAIAARSRGAGRFLFTMSNSTFTVCRGSGLGSP